jgi:hypothetical protein
VVFLAEIPGLPLQTSGVFGVMVSSGIFFVVGLLPFIRLGRWARPLLGVVL